MRERLGIEDPQKVWRPLFEKYNQTVAGLRCVPNHLASASLFELYCALGCHPSVYVYLSVYLYEVPTRCPRFVPSSTAARKSKVIQLLFPTRELPNIFCN